MTVQQQDRDHYCWYHCAGETVTGHHKQDTRTDFQLARTDVEDCSDLIQSLSELIESLSELFFAGSLVKARIARGWPSETQCLYRAQQHKYDLGNGEDLMDPAYTVL